MARRKPPVERPKPTLSLDAVIVEMLQINEAAPVNRRFTDSHIRHHAARRLGLPQRDVSSNTVAGIRDRYNAGEFTDSTPPTPLSYAYDARGEAITKQD